MKSKRSARSLVTQTEKIAAIAVYDYTTALLADAAGIDLVLVGDSLAQGMQGEKNTLPVTLDQMIYHSRCVSNAVLNAMVIGDMPFSTYHISTERTLEAAFRFVQEGRVDGVKIEGGAKRAHMIEAIASAEIPVLAHIGLTPQSFLAMGGYRVQGKVAKPGDAAFGETSRDQLLKDAKAVQDAGAFGVVLEGIPQALGAEITRELSIPTIGIGAGDQCRGQILVINDVLGLSTARPKFAKRYVDLHQAISAALTSYIDEVRSGAFPDADHSH